jgi:hypothetical protein
VDRGYESVGKAMAPLGFEVTERPSSRCDLWLAERLTEC